MAPLIALSEGKGNDATLTEHDRPVVLVIDDGTTVRATVAAVAEARAGRLPYCSSGKCPR